MNGYQKVIKYLFMLGLISLPACSTDWKPVGKTEIAKTTFFFAWLSVSVEIGTVWEMTSPW